MFTCVLKFVLRPNLITVWFVFFFVFAGYSKIQGIQIITPRCVNKTGAAVIQVQIITRKSAQVHQRYRKQRRSLFDYESHRSCREDKQIDQRQHGFRFDSRIWRKFRLYIVEPMPYKLEFIIGWKMKIIRIGFDFG